MRLAARLAPFNQAAYVCGRDVSRDTRDELLPRSFERPAISNDVRCSPLDIARNARAGGRWRLRELRDQRLSALDHFCRRGTASERQREADSDLLHGFPLLVLSALSALFLELCGQLRLKGFNPA